MPKIQSHDFTIGASFRVFSKYGPVKSLSTKGEIQPFGDGFKVDVEPVSGEKTFMDAIDKMINSFPSPVEIEPNKKVIADNTLPLDGDIFNAYTNKEVYTKVHNSDGFGDVVINWTTEELDPLESTHFEACSWLTQTLDQYLGLPSILWDSYHTRRSLYGKPGNFTPTPRGMKYKVLSNAWIKKPQFKALVYGNTIDAIKALFNSEEAYKKEYFGISAKHIIDTNDKKSVSNLLEFSDIKSPLFYREKLGISKENA